MKFERKTISSRQLDLLANNPRTITKESLDRLCESIRRNGFWEHMPVAVEPVEGTDRFRVLHGNQRVKAMRMLKRYDIPCVIYYELTSPERDEIILRGNINNGEWDYGDRNRMVCLRLSDEAVTKLDRLTDNRSEYIDRMIKEQPE